LKLERINGTYLHQSQKKKSEINQIRAKRYLCKYRTCQLLELRLFKIIRPKVTTGRFCGRGWGRGAVKFQGEKLIEWGGGGEMGSLCILGIEKKLKK
jgi:hypothetical protein